MAALAAVRKGEVGLMRMGTYNPFSGDGRVHWKDPKPKEGHAFDLRELTRLATC